MKTINDFDFLFKYVMIGDTNVGKSSILLQFVENRFRQEYDPTIGVEFGSKLLNLFSKNIKLQVWDTAGQESFRSITRSYYRNSIGAMLVYDITNQDSFENVQIWLREIKTYSHEKINIILIGNKIDMAPKRQVSKDAAQEFARQNDICFMETSAKLAQNIDDAFIILTENIMQQLLDGKIDITKEVYGIKVGPKKSQTISPGQVDNQQTNKKECEC